ncbi:MAG: hypothetical protein KF729_09185 [Sandaracinaceae bacterium]|nr:hypothetical protein [Sandaracinaceae bacterium]
MAGPPQGPRTDALAVVSLVCGILGALGGLVNVVLMFFGTCCPVCAFSATALGLVALVPSIAGLVCGLVSLKRIKEQSDALEGKGLAMGGSVVSGIAIVVAIITIVLPWAGIGCLMANDMNRTRPWTPPPAWEPPATPAPPVDPGIDPGIDPGLAPLDPVAPDPSVDPVDPPPAP